MQPETFASCSSRESINLVMLSFALLASLFGRIVRSAFAVVRLLERRVYALAHIQLCSRQMIRSVS